MLRKLEYIFRRIILSVGVLFALSIVVFILTRVVPSNPAALYLGSRARPEEIERVTKEFGFDKPLHEQYLIYLDDVLHGNLGDSIGTKRPVVQEIRERLPATLELLIAAVILTILIGIPLGVLSAQFNGSSVDVFVRVFSLIGVSMPAFWLGLLLQLLFFYELNEMFPLARRVDSTLRFTSPIEEITGFYVIDTLYTQNWVAFRDVTSRIVLPSLTLAAYPIGLVARMTRASMLEVLEQDYIRTSRAYGIRWHVIMYNYALKNAIIPSLTVIGLTVAYLLTGAFYVEEIFNWPGLGQFTIRAFLNVDYPAIMGVTLFAATGYIVVNLTIDLIQAWIDPRISLQ